MNVADSQRLESAFEKLGLESTSHTADADVIVLNTCVVRRRKNKAYSYLQSLRPLKAKRPEIVIGLMGCLVGVKSNGRLRERFPMGGCLCAAQRPDADGRVFCASARGWLLK